MMTNELSRRQMLKTSVTAGGLALFALNNLRVSQLEAEGPQDEFRGGRLLGHLEFIDESNVPLDTLMGEGLDGRLFTDLSAVGPDHSTTRTDRFYVRTRASELLNTGKPWQIKLTGTARKEGTIDILTLRKMSQPAGLHLMECSGNVRAAHFGMLSVADWAGTRISDVLDLAGIQKPSSLLLISGFDEYPDPSETSQPGASWIFTVDELIAAGSFLAVNMNGADLSRDHGAPVRLVVPGWYGCTCIKWVNEIQVVNEDVPATSQMHEFASRTMQSGEPELAKEYRPAVIDQAAMPVRIEKWSIRGEIKYRVCGIAWGGSRLCKGLEIRFHTAEHFVPVDSFQQTANDPWSFWSHNWTPSKRGIYNLHLRLTDESIPAKRLKEGYYMRSVEITEI
jgi:DMSO/TMAO reductase YedYZ molybdopterin-dependent catalytic subunit